MTRSTMDKFRAAYGDKPVTAARMNDLYIHFYEEALEVQKELAETRVANPRSHQARGLRACRDAEMVLCMMYIFGMLEGGQHEEKIRTLHNVGFEIFTVGL